MFTSVRVKECLISTGTFTWKGGTSPVTTIIVNVYLFRRVCLQNRNIPSFKYFFLNCKKGLLLLLCKNPRKRSLIIYCFMESQIFSYKYRLRIQIRYTVSIRIFPSTKGTRLKRCVRHGLFCLKSFFENDGVSFETSKMSHIS